MRRVYLSVNMWLRQWLAPPRQLLVVFAITLIPAVAGGWLTWRLIEQDRSLARQRNQENLESIADRIAAVSQQRLSELDNRVAALSAPEHMVLVTVQRDSIEVNPSGALSYYPVLPSAEEPPPAIFAEAEKYEFQLNDPMKAIDAFRALARHPSASVRAGALLRLGRNLRKAGQLENAMQAYDELARLGSTRVAGLPAALLAQEARCTVLEQMGKKFELTREARLLHDDLSSGRWPLLRAAYRFHLEEARRWMGGQAETEHEHGRNAMAGAFEWLWRQSRTGAPPARQQKILSVEGRPVLLAWRYSPDRLVALLTGPEYLERAWRGIRDFQSVRILLTDADGSAVLGAAPDGVSPHVVRTSDMTGLPWTLRIGSANPVRDLAGVAARRRLFLAGFALTMLALAAATYFSLRAIGRELAVARLQSDFVAAVSHEFRTPLTAVRQFSEMLMKGRVPTEELRQQCYQLLDREGERLQKLVEDLLDFGRIESGRDRYQFAPQDAGELVRGIVARFQDKVTPKGIHVELEAPPDALSVSADGEALGRAIWNLLDNAVKYSPDSQTVWVELKRESDSLAIRVRDRGIGIPAGEQKEIFKKFVRGSNSQLPQIAGTGVGLAIVQHIVQAHRGRIRVESQPDLGSTFTVLLPMRRPA
jgi:signal transduction histidine kinase